MGTNEHDAADWTLVTVTYNSAVQLRECWGASDVGRARWIVVDNASTDDSAEVASSLGAEVLRLTTNVGFSAANNVGLAVVATPWTMFVNPDVCVASGHDLSRLSAVSLSNDSAFVAPQLLNPDGTKQPNARGLPFLVDKLANRSVKLPGSRLEEYARSGFSGPTYAAWVIGAAMGGPTTSFRQLGGWDDGFFVYYEDHDIGLRAWEYGHPVVVDPSVLWLHQWQRATARLHPGPWKHELKSMHRFYQRYPELLTRRRLARCGGFASLRSRLWTAASDPTGSIGVSP